MLAKRAQFHSLFVGFSVRQLSRRAVPNSVHDVHAEAELGIVHTARSQFHFHHEGGIACHIEGDSRWLVAECPDRRHNRATRWRRETKPKLAVRIESSRAPAGRRSAYPCGVQQMNRGRCQRGRKGVTLKAGGPTNDATAHFAARWSRDRNDRAQLQRLD